MSKPIVVSSSAEFEKILRTSRIVVADFYADWCGPCRVVAPVYEQLSSHLSIPNQITFVKINVETNEEISSRYHVNAMPTFIVFKESQIVEKFTGANKEKIQTVVQKIIDETRGGAVASSGGFGSPSSNGSSWRTTELPRGHKDVTEQVDIQGLDLMNSDSNFGRAQVLFENTKPSGLEKDNNTSTVNKAKDWIESDTDEQLMLFIPFQSTLKTHSLQITSLPDGHSENTSLRPRTIQIYPNRARILGFEEAESYSPTQTITLTENDWDQTGTATISLHFVKFQNVTSLILFIVDGDGDGERTRIDRIRIVGETGEKRNPGMLEKLED